MSHKRRRSVNTPASSTSLDLQSLLQPTRDGATAEDQMMWRCARVTLTESNLAEVARLGEGLDELEWMHLVAVARENGVDNLLFTHIVAAGLLPLAPGHLVDLMRQRYGSVAIFTRRLEIQLERLVHSLQLAGQEIIVVKGMALARRLYGDLALRPISDVDVLVRLEGAPKWTQAFHAAGFAPVWGRNEPLSKHVLRYHEMQFRNAHQQTLEAHTAICRYPAYQRAFPAREIWARARPLDGYPGALALAPADEMCFLCMHYAVQHQMGRLIWLTDIAEIASRIPDSEEWEALATDVIARGAAAAVAVTLARAQALLDAPIPFPTLERLRAAALQPSQRRAWASAIRPMTGARWYLSQFRALRKPAERAALLWHGGMALMRQARLAMRADGVER